MGFEKSVTQAGTLNEADVGGSTVIVGIGDSVKVGAARGEVGVAAGSDRNKSMAPHARVNSSAAIQSPKRFADSKFFPHLSVYF
jgi:hypothetical protein